MVKGPYERFERQELILRDELAIDRTLLANERTLLAYLRSAVALLIAGLTIIQFAKAAWFVAIGAACLPAAVVAAILGIRRYRRMAGAIRIIRKRMQETTVSGETAAGGPAD